MSRRAARPRRLRLRLRLPGRPAGRRAAALPDQRRAHARASRPRHRSDRGRGHVIPSVSDGSGAPGRFTARPDAARCAQDDGAVDIVFFEATSMRPAPTSQVAAASRNFVHLREGIENFLRFARAGSGRKPRMRERLARALRRRPPPRARRDARERAALSRAGREAALLPLHGVPHGPRPREQPRRTSASTTTRKADHRRARRRPRGARIARARRRARQRRPRTPRRVLPRLAGHARLSRLRLRHQLRVRPLPPDIRERLSAREARPLARRRIAVADRAHRRSGDRPGLRQRSRTRTIASGVVHAEVGRLQA